jgi:hypothetical protein
VLIPLGLLIGVMILVGRRLPWWRSAENGRAA